MESSGGRIPPEIEATIKAIAANTNQAEAAQLLASLANRATTALHQLARGAASARKGHSDWGRWASLVNVSRDAVLRTATCRQTANQLLQAERSTTQPIESER